ncbi:hypothetical protein, partial [Paenibacillus ginsengihumi]|uniref:hypothetical protein n=1 Tax=Paenibacillus ginsengihumi TaxID=431596 RepID=UPI001B7F8AF0
RYGLRIGRKAELRLEIRKELATAWSHASLAPEPIPLSSTSMPICSLVYAATDGGRGAKHLYQFPCPIFKGFLEIRRANFGW